MQAICLFGTWMIGAYLLHTLWLCGVCVWLICVWFMLDDWKMCACWVFTEFVLMCTCSCFWCVLCFVHYLGFRLYAYSSSPCSCSLPNIVEPNCCIVSALTNQSRLWLLINPITRGGGHEDQLNTSYWDTKNACIRFVHLKVYLGIFSKSHQAHSL